MSSVWQYPHVNLFKTFGVGQWKKCSKEGDVSSLMDREIKSTVYRVLGSIPAANYIQIPKTSSQSLSLTGQYVYISFKPLPSKYFVLHVEVVTSSGMVVRISFSNLFKEFKSTLTWLQFPFASSLTETVEKDSDRKGHRGQRKDYPESARASPSSTRWTLLKLDLKAILSKYLHTKYAYIKNMKVCANLLVKNVLTSGFDYSPLTGDSVSSSKYSQLLPREISFPLTKDEDFLQKYDYVQFPLIQTDSSKTGQKLSSHKLKGMHSHMTHISSNEGGEKKHERSVRSSMKGSTKRDGKVGSHDCLDHKELEVDLGPLRGRSSASQTALAAKIKNQSHRYRSSREELPLDSTTARRRMVPENPNQARQEEVHVYAENGAEVAIHHGRNKESKQISIRSAPQRKPEFQSLQPDPILELRKVIGFGGHSTGQVLFGGEGESVIYPCHSLVVNMDIQSGQQRFYIGHTDKVSCISLNATGTLLASGQAGTLPMVRLWEVHSRRCLALFKSHSNGLHTLSFSHSGSVLCGVGRDSHGKSQVVLWGTAQASRSGDVSVITKAHTDAGINRMRIAGFDDSRMVSCGWDNVRFWRLRGSSLRSCPVNLEKHHQMHFTDVQFQPGFHNESDLTDRNIYACTKTGHVFEIHYKTISVKRVWHLLPSNTGGVSIHSLCVHEAFCVTGSDDGVLRVWPLDFSAVFMEAEHDGAVTAVSINEDGMRVLAGTSSGNIGLLDASKNSYTTLMRSHRDHVQCMSLPRSQTGSSNSPWLVTCSKDHTIRVWDVYTGAQLFNFHAPGDHGSSVAWHPTKQVFACGFHSGAVRLFHVPTTTVLSEHKHHKGSITGTVFSPKGHILYSCSSSGSLAMYDISDIRTCKVARLLGNTVAKGEGFGPCALSVCESGERLAFIGPLESTVTLLDAETLDEVLRLNITPMSTPHSTIGMPDTTGLNAAKIVTFAPDVLNQLLVITSGSRLLKFNSSNGQLLSDVAHIHRTQCTAVSLSRDGRYLFTAGDNVVKVWDYGMTLDLNFQVFIGHSEAISQVDLTPGGDQIVSCGDAILLWNFSGSLPHSPHLSTSTPPHIPHKALSGTRSALPRRKAPAPMNYEPIKMHSFTPLGPAPRHKSMQNTLKHLGSTQCEGDPKLHVDDDNVYEPHVDSDTSSDSHEPIDKKQTTSVHLTNIDPSSVTNDHNEISVTQEDKQNHSEENINLFKHRNFEQETSNDGIGDEDTADSEEVDISQTPDWDIIVKANPSRSPLHTSPSSQSHTQETPTSLKHYCHSPPKSSLAEHLYVAPPDQAGLKRRMVLGVSGTGRNNVIWEPNSGLFVYNSGCIVVLEDLSNGEQKHLIGHTEEISTLAAQHDSRILASASPAFGHTPCEIRIWKISSSKCTKVLTVHCRSVQCMAFSRDDRLLLSIGTYKDNTVAMWSTHNYSLLSATTLDHPVHEAKWDPCVAYEFTSVGTNIKFWLVEEDSGGKTCELKVHEPVIPAEVLQTQSKSNMEFTSLCYGTNSMLFIGTNNGVITLWETKENKCLMYWTTDPYEISSLFSSADKLSSADINGSLKLWTIDSSTSDSLPVVSLENSMEVDGAVFSSNFDDNVELGVVGTTTGNVYYISWNDSTKVDLVNGLSARITSVAFTQDSSHFAITSEDGSLAVWRVDTMERIVLFQALKNACNCVAFAPLSNPLGFSVNEQGQAGASPSSTVPDIVAGYSDGTLRIFDIVNVKMTRKMQPHAEAVHAVAYSLGGHAILSGCSSGMVAISNPSTGLVVRVITDHQGAPINDIHLANKPIKLPGLGVEECFLWLVASGDRRVSVWNSEWNKDRCQLIDWLTFPGPFFAPDGTRLKKGDKCQYSLLPPCHARFSPANPDTIIYTGYGLEKCVQFYSISKKTVTRTCALTHWVTCMDVSPDGHLLGFGCEERVLKLMDPEEGSFQDYTGHQDTVAKVKFSTDGKHLISSSGSSIHVWDITV